MGTGRHSFIQYIDQCFSMTVKRGSVLAESGDRGGGTWRIGCLPIAIIQAYGFKTGVGKLLCSMVTSFFFF